MILWYMINDLILVIQMIKSQSIILYFKYTQIHVHISLHICSFTCIHICIFLCMHILLYMYVRLFLYKFLVLQSWLQERLLQASQIQLYYFYFFISSYSIHLFHNLPRLCALYKKCNLKYSHKTTRYHNNNLNNNPNNYCNNNNFMFWFALWQCLKLYLNINLPCKYLFILLNLGKQSELIPPIPPPLYSCWICCISFYFSVFSVWYFRQCVAIAYRFAGCLCLL